MPQKKFLYNIEYLKQDEDIKMVRSIPPYASDDYPTAVTEDTINNYLIDAYISGNTENIKSMHSMVAQVIDTEDNTEETTNETSIIDDTVTTEKFALLDAYMSGNSESMKSEHSKVIPINTATELAKTGSVSSEHYIAAYPENNKIETNSILISQINSENTSVSSNTISKHNDMNSKVDCQCVLTDLGFPFGVIMWGREAILQYANTHKITFSNNFQETFDRYYPKT